MPFPIGNPLPSVLLLLIPKTSHGPCEKNEASPRSHTRQLCGEMQSLVTIRAGLEYGSVKKSQHMLQSAVAKYGKSGGCR